MDLIIGCIIGYIVINVFAVIFGVPIGIWLYGGKIGRWIMVALIVALVLHTYFVAVPESNKFCQDDPSQPGCYKWLHGTDN